jgi:hypothetical protein
MNRKSGWTYLRPWSGSTQQEKWDDQIALNHDYVESKRRWIPLLRRLGFHGWADRILTDTACPLAIAERMEVCPNNPRHGGDGFGKAGDRTFVDRRIEYVQQNDHLVVRFPVDSPAEWQVELLDNTLETHTALQQLQDRFGHECAIAVRSQGENHG